MMNLNETAEDIRLIIEKKREEFGLEFFEDEHKYLMKDLDGNVRDNFPSVSKVLKKFYDEFPTEEAALKKSGGDYIEAERLMEEGGMRNPSGEGSIQFHTSGDAAVFESLLPKLLGESGKVDRLVWKGEERLVRP